MQFKRKKILLLRPHPEGLKTKQDLEAKGAKVTWLPLIKIVEPAEGYERLDLALAHLDTYDGILITSAHAFGAIRSRNRRYREEKIIRADKSGAADIFRQLEKERIAGKRYLYPCSQLAAEDLPKVLGARGAIVDKVIAYETHFCRENYPLIGKAIEEGLDFIFIYSPSQFQALLEAIDHRKSLILANTLVAWGETTRRFIEVHGFNCRGR